jgi:hypothetical protein
MVHLKRVRMASHYIAEHRLVASRAIGRILESHEVVIHIRESGGNVADNLFICASRSEYAKRREGSLAWPKKSNLRTYRDRRKRA